MRGEPTIQGDTTKRRHKVARGWRRGLLLSTLFASTLLAGCSTQYIRDKASRQMQEGQYEQAMTTLQEGVAQHPDSALLRAGLASAQTDVIGRLLAQATAEQVAGQWSAAAGTLERARKLNPNDPRVRDMAAQLQAEELAIKALVKARELAKGGTPAQFTQALQALEEGLQRAPRQPDLLAYKRQLESSLRQGSAYAAQHQLNEMRPISLSFRQAPLSSLLEALRDGTGVNFVVDRDVQTDQRASVYIREAKLEDAIDLVLSAFALSRRIVDGKTVLIYPNTPEKHKEHREQVIRVFHLSNADAKATATMLQNLLRVQAPYVDEKANMLALREPPEIVALAERLIGLHDLGEAEVMLDVEVLEINSSRLTELGINFPNNFSLSLLPLPNQTGITVDTFNNLNLRGGGRGINYAQVGLTVGSLLVNLKREVGDFNTLANPRIRTRNRQKATILVGDKVPVITTTAASSGGFVSESVNYLDVGLKLEVEPVVSPDDEVQIKVGLEVSTLAGEVRSPGGSVAYQIGTRNANTMLRLRDGETQVLGGLISRDDRVSSNRVPGLGDLPVAGRLFSSQKDDLKKTELVLAITPRILRSAPSPDIAQAEMWVGTENFTRLRPPPVSGLRAAASDKSAPGANTGQPAGGQSAAPSDQQGMTLSFDGPAQMKVGEEATITLKVKADAPLTALPLNMKFTPGTLQILGVSEGDFFQQKEAVSSFTHAVNAKEGRLNFGLLGGAGQGVTGEGSVLQVRVKAIAAGEASIAVHSGEVQGVNRVLPMKDKPQWSVKLP